MEPAQQTALFPAEGPTSDRWRQSEGVQPSEGAPAATRQTPAPGASTRRWPWQERLEELGLRPGCAYVYRVDGRLLAWGDFSHCPAEDIAHNIRALADELRRHPRLRGIGKSYQADVHRLEKAGDWERTRREVTDLYRERWLLVGEDGSLTPEGEPQGEHNETQHETPPARREVMEQQAKVETRKNGHTPPAAPPPANGALDILWDGLPPRVVEQLSQPLDPSLVSHRRGRGGRSVPYLEGHAAIAQANRVFGYGGWGYEVVGEVACREARSVDEKTGEVKVALLYCATVKVTVPGVPPRTDVGCHPVAEDTADGHDTAYKGAVTDALKRALRSFGDQFGNALYGEGGENDLVPSLRESLVQLGRNQGLAEARLREAVRKRTGKDLEALSATELAGLLEAMARKRASADGAGQAPASPHQGGSQSPAPRQ